MKWFKLKIHKLLRDTPKLVLALGAVMAIGGGAAIATIGIGGGMFGGGVNLQDGLIGHWKLNGNAKDTTIYNNHGTIYGATSTADRHGQANSAYSFDGTDDYVNLGDKSEFEFNSGESFSAAFWMKPTSIANNSSPLNKHYGTQGEKRPWYLFRYRNSTSASNDINWMVRNSSGAQAQINAGTNLLNEWHHVVGIYDGSANELRIYVDGVLKNTATNVPVGAYGTNSGFLEIGFHATETFPGLMDDIRLYDRTLSSDEVSALHDSYDSSGVQVASTQKNLVSHWKMDGNGSDATPYSNHGTVNGATSTTDRHGSSNSALNFDGTNDDIRGTSQPSVQTNPNLFTVSGYINPGNQYSRFITPQSAGIDQWIGYDAINERLEITVAESADTNQRRRHSTIGSVPLNTWTHWAVVINGLNIKIYINGELDQEYNESISIAGWNNEWRIGQRGNGTNWLLGKLDDIRVYGRELSPSEIRDLNDSYSPEVQISDLQKDLVGNWSFNGDAKDKTPYSNHGTLRGNPVLTTDRHGRAGSAYDFDGIDDYVEGVNNNLTDWPDGITVSVWVKSDTVNWNDTGMLISKRQSFILHPSSGSKTIQFYRSSGGFWDSVAYTTSADLTQWNHYVGTYDNSTLKLYENGELKRSKNVTGTIDSDTGNVFLGRDDGLSRYLDGQLDGVRVYKRALSDAEVRTLFQTYH